MLELNIPGQKKLLLEHLVLDFNGTLALDGQIIPGVLERLEKLTRALSVHILTADTHGNVHKQFVGRDYTIHVLEASAQDKGKLNYIQNLGMKKCVCMGNGANDSLMLEQAALSIAVLQEEGAAIQAVMAAQVVVKNILDGLDLLIHPLRLVATLRR
ncbi:HAD family hydrolase [Desulfovulcanus sp.]